MKIALIGYGKMGKAIEELALSRGHVIVGYFSQKTWDMQMLAEADICIEFTQPTATLDNIKKIASFKKNIIVGTTGWYSHLNEVQEVINKYNIGLLYSSNFSLGINIYQELLEQAAKLFNQFSEYDVAGIEYHHNQKKDAPSGTAISLSEIVNNHMPQMSDFQFSSVRCGQIVGIHTLLFDSAFDTITLTHEAKNRQGFAAGVIQAAEWMQNKSGLYTFTDCIKNILQRNQL